jgi:hypothetical protein
MFNRKRLRKLIDTNARYADELSELRDTREAYDQFQRWAVVHAPATIERYTKATGFELPLWKLTQMEMMNAVIKDAYAPLLRAAFADSMPLFEQLMQTPQDSPLIVVHEL